MHNARFDLFEIESPAMQAVTCVACVFVSNGIKPRTSQESPFCQDPHFFESFHKLLALITLVWNIPCLKFTTTIFGKKSQVKLTELTNFYSKKGVEFALFLFPFVTTNNNTCPWNYWTIIIMTNNFNTREHQRNASRNERLTQLTN